MKPEQEGPISNSQAESDMTPLDLGVSLRTARDAAVAKYNGKLQKIQTATGLALRTRRLSGKRYK